MTDKKPISEIDLGQLGDVQGGNCRMVCDSEYSSPTRYQTYHRSTYSSNSCPPRRRYAASRQTYSRRTYSTATACPQVTVNNISGRDPGEWSMFS
jgi:hypothetical protein